MKDRMLFNEDGRTLDELLISKANVHLEQLDDHLFMLIVENEQRHCHLRIGSRSHRAKVDAWVYEAFEK